MTYHKLKMADVGYHSESPPLKGQDEVKVEYAGEESNGVLHTVDKGFTDVYAEASHAEQRRVLSKVDYRLVPLLTLLYLVSFVDRSNSTYSIFERLSPSLQHEILPSISPYSQNASKMHQYQLT